jgi:hypothetical protein
MPYQAELSRTVADVVKHLGNVYGGSPETEPVGVGPRCQPNATFDSEEALEPPRVALRGLEAVVRWCLAGILAAMKQLCYADTASGA